MLEVGKEYYVASHSYKNLDAMSKVRVHNDDYPDESERYVVNRGEDGDWLWSGYVKVEDLLTADQIIKLRDEHLLLVDAYAQDWIEGRQKEMVTQESFDGALAIRWGNAMDSDNAA